MKNLRYEIENLKIIASGCDKRLEQILLTAGRNIALATLDSIPKRRGAKWHHLARVIVDEELPEFTEEEDPE